MFELIVIVALVAGAFYWQEQDRRKFEREMREAKERGWREFEREMREAEERGRLMAESWSKGRD